MPHPVARPTTATPTRRTPPTRRKGRRGLALLVGVAAASVAVLGFLQLTGGSPGPADDGGGGSAVGTPPTAKTAHTSKTGAVAKAKASHTSRTKAVAKAKAATKTAPKSKSKAAATPAQPKPSNPKAAQPKPTQPKTHQPTPKPKAAQSKPSTESGTERVEQHDAVTGSESDHRGSRARTDDTAVRLGSGGRGDGIPRRAVQGGRPRAGAGDEGARPRARFHLALRGRTVRLTPGTYRWYVWPVTKSGRATQAVVQAKLTVPSALSSRGRRLPMRNVDGLCGEHHRASCRRPLEDHSRAGPRRSRALRQRAPSPSALLPPSAPTAPVAQPPPGRVARERPAVNGSAALGPDEADRLVVGVGRRALEDPLAGAATAIVSPFEIGGAAAPMTAASVRRTRSRRPGSAVPRDRTDCGERRRRRETWRARLRPLLRRVLRRPPFRRAAAVLPHR